MSETPKKRQRLTGSFSPDSPPYHLAKTSDHQTKPLIIHPNTPTSPPYMSSESQGNGSRPSVATAQPAEMTPPSSVSVSQHVSQPPTHTNNPFPIPTPASSTGAPTSYGNKDSDGDAIMTDDSNDYLARSGDDLTASTADQHRRSDHDRQGNGLQARFEIQSAYGASLYKLCETPHSISRPHTSQNLIDLYGLTAIADKFIRKDPMTGEKKNKLRKSYEGQVKKLQIAGKSKAVSKPEGYLLDKIMYPDEEWYYQSAHGKELKNGLSQELLASLDDALSMAPGPLPAGETEKWRSYIATTDDTKVKAVTEIPGKKGAQPAPNVRNPAVPSPAMKAARVGRPGAKRRYDDASFSGYGDGFVDDDIDGSTGDEDGRSGFAKKKRRKDFAAGSPFGLHERAGYQMGMVGGRR